MTLGPVSDQQWEDYKSSIALAGAVQTDTQRYWGVTAPTTYFPIQGEQNYQDIQGAPPGWDYKTATRGWNNEPLPNGAISFDRFGEPYYGEGLFAWFKKLAANVTDPYVHEVEKPNYIQDPDSFFEHVNNTLSWAGYQLDVLGNLGGTKKVQVNPETGEEEEVEKPTALTYGSRLVGSAVQAVLDIFGFSAIAAERVLGGYAIGINEVAKFSDLPEMPSLFGGADDTGDTGIWGNIKNGLEILDRTVNPIRLIWDTVRAVDAPLTMSQKKENFDLGFAAGRIAYSAVYDVQLRNEFMRRLAAGEDAGLLSRELMNPLAEAWGQIVVDPLNVVGYFLTKAKKMGAVIGSIEELASATPEIKAAVKTLDEAQKIGDATKVAPALETFVGAVKKSTDAIRKGISRTAEADGLGLLWVNTTESARKLRMSNASDFLSWLAGEVADESEFFAMVKGVMNLASEFDDEIALGADLVSGFFKPDLLMSRQALETGVLLRGLFTGASEGLDAKKVAGFLKGFEKFLGELENVDDLSKIEKLVGYIEPKLAAAAKDMFPTIAERVAKGDKVSRIAVIASKGHAKMQKFYGPLNQFFANIYMGMSPGYAARNWMSNNFHIFADRGFGAFFESTQRGHNLPHFVSIEFAENGIREWLGGWLPSSVRGFSQVPEFAAEEGTKVRKWMQPFMKLSEMLERRAAVRMVYKDVKDVMNHMLQEGRALPSLQSLRDAGLPQEMGNLLVDLVLKHKGNVDNAMSEWHKLANSGRINLGRTLLWASADDLRKLDDLLPGTDVTGQLRKILDESEDLDVAVSKLNEIRQSFYDQLDLAKFEPTHIRGEGIDMLGKEELVLAQNLQSEGVLRPGFAEVKADQYVYNEQAIYAFEEAVGQDFLAIQQRLVEAGVSSDDLKRVQALKNDERYAGYFNRTELGKLRTKWHEKRTQALAYSDKWKQMIADGVKDPKVWAKEWVEWATANNMGDPPVNLTGQQLINWMWDGWFFRERSREYNAFRDMFGAGVVELYTQLDKMIGEIVGAAEYAETFKPLSNGKLLEARKMLAQAQLFDNVRYMHDWGRYPFTPGKNAVWDGIVHLANAYGIDTQSKAGALNPHIMNVVNDQLRKAVNFVPTKTKKGFEYKDVRDLVQHIVSLDKGFIPNKLGGPGSIAFTNEAGDIARINLSIQAGVIRLNDIEVPLEYRGKGLATEAMNALQDFAMEMGVRLTGTAKAFGDAPKMSTAQLKKWYKSLGWKMEGAKGGKMFFDGAIQAGEIPAEIKWAENFVNFDSGIVDQFDNMNDFRQAIYDGRVSFDVVEGALRARAKEKGKPVLDLKYIRTVLEEELKYAEEVTDKNFPSVEEIHELFGQPHEKRLVGNLAPDPDYIMLQKEAGLPDEFIVDNILPSPTEMTFADVFGDPLEAGFRKGDFLSPSEQFFDPKGYSDQLKRAKFGDDVDDLTIFDAQTGKYINYDTGEPVDDIFGDLVGDLMDDLDEGANPYDEFDLETAHEMNVADYMEHEDKLIEIIQQAELEDPLLAAILRWVTYGGTMHDGSGGGNMKKQLLQAMKMYPEKAQQIQDYTQLALREQNIKNLNVYNGKLTLWRGMGASRQTVFPWDSMTTSQAIATDFAMKNGGPLLEWEIPVENLWTTYMTHPSFDIYNDQEIILNARGTYGATLKSVNGKPATQDDILKYSLHLPKEDPARVAGTLPLPKAPTKGSAPSWQEALRHNFHSGSNELDDYNKLFDRITQGIKDNWGKELVTTGVEAHDEALNAWAQGAKGGVAEARLHAQNVAKAGRDFALHNYDDRKNLDLVFAYIYPYHFWYGRTYKNWMRRAVDPVQGSPGLIAAYSKYRTLLEREHAGSPDWWKYNVNTNELFGFQSENPLYFNLEATLNPLNGLTGVDFSDPYRRSTWYSAMLEDLNRYGPTTFTPFNFAVAFALMQRGEDEAASRFGTRLFPQSLAFESLYSLVDKHTGVDLSKAPLLGYLAKDPAVSFFSGGQDAYKRNRIGRAIGWLVQENKEYEAEILEDANNQSGEWWDAAVARATQARAPGQLASFLFGVGFKARSRGDLEIDRFYGDLHRLYEMRETLHKDEFTAQFSQLREKYPFMDGVLLARKHGIERDVAYAFNVLSRIPPGGQNEIMGALGIEQELVNKFYDEKANMEKWPESDRMRFMAAIVDVGAILDIPPLATRQEWQEARSAYSRVMEMAPFFFGENIQALADGYFALLDGTNAGKQAGYKYLDMYPQVEQFLTWKEQAVTQDPLLNAYYGGIESIHYYWKGLMYDEAEQLFGRDILQVQTTYYSLREAGEFKEASKYKKLHPELEAYWEFKAEKEKEIAQRLIGISTKLPEGKDVSLRDTRGEELSYGAKSVAGAVEGGVVPSQQLPPEFYIEALGANTYALVLDAIFTGEPLTDHVADEVTEVAASMGITVEMLLEMLASTIANVP